MYPDMTRLRSFQFFERFGERLQCKVDLKMLIFHVLFGSHPRKMKRGPQYLFLFQSSNMGARSLSASHTASICLR